MNSIIWKTKLEAWLPYFVYIALSLAIMGPLLFPGYVLNLDMIFAPSMDSNHQFYGLSESLSSGVLIWLFLHGASGIIPAWFLQKVILFFIFFLSGIGVHRLFPGRGTGVYFAGALYMVNPFTYVRFMAGQWGVLLAYALIPFAIKAFIELLESKEEHQLKQVIKVAMLSTLVGMLQIQGFFLLFLAFLIILVVKVVVERKAPVRITQACKYSGISAGIFLALNIYWLIPTLPAGRSLIGQIGQSDPLLFVPGATSRIMFDVASMYGFWRGGYLYTQDILPFWWLLFLFLLFLVTYGFICKLKDNSHGWIVISFGVVGVVSFLLAVGAATDLTKPLFEWLWAHVPFIRGFRDSHKFVALLCLSYAYLGGLGVNEFASTLRRQRKRLARVALMSLVAVAMLTPLGYSFTSFGFHGQLGVINYPKEWYEVNKYLNDDKDDFNVLFLPWHQYMDYSWLPNMDKRLANPARAFFDKPVIQGDNIELPGIYSQSTNPISKYVEFLLSNGRNVNNLGELLAPLNVKYIMLVHEADYASYDFLHHQDDLKVEVERQGLTLFRNEHQIARIYGVNGAVYVESLDEYLELSHEQNVMEYLYILDSGPSSSIDSDMQELDFIKNNPVKYRIDETADRYTIFTVPQDVNSEHWQHDGKKPLKNLGLMPTFERIKNGDEIVYTRFYYVYLPSYIISAVALIILMVAYFNMEKIVRLFRHMAKRLPSK